VSYTEKQSQATTASMSMDVSFNAKDTFLITEMKSITCWTIGRVTCWPCEILKSMGQKELRSFKDLYDTLVYHINLQRISTLPAG
jgi:hypothetical protein